MNCDKDIVGSLYVTSNFIKHLKRSHQAKHREYIKLKSSKKHKKSKIAPQDQFDSNVVNFMVDNYLPISIIEKDSFKKLFEDSKFSIKSKKSFNGIVTGKFEEIRNCIKEKLSQVEYVCTTADVWSGNKKSFLGYTVHFL